MYLDKMKIFDHCNKVMLRTFHFLIYFHVEENMKRTDVSKLWPLVLDPKFQDIKKGSFLPKQLFNHHSSRHPEA